MGYGEFGRVQFITGFNINLVLLWHPHLSQRTGQINHQLMDASALFFTVPWLELINTHLTVYHFL